MSELTEFHCQRLSQLRQDRSNWDTQWEEAAARVMPAHRNTFLSRGFGTDQTGQKNTELQFDSTVSIAAQRFSAVMESLVTPQASIWHLLKPVDAALKKNRAVRRFFDDLNDVLFNYRYRPVANFVGNSQQVYHGLGVYGNGILFVDKPDGGKGLRYKNIHLGETYLVENHAGVVDTIYRVFRLTARQILMNPLFEGRVPEDIADAARSPQTSEKKFGLIHCVAPRKDYDPVRKDALGMAFMSIYILEETKELLREGGFETFPYAVARYTQAAGEVYGRGPAQMVLPAIKVLNEEKKTILKQGHRIVDPVLLAHDDGNLGSFSLKAGALNAGGVSKEGRALIQPLPVGNIMIGDKLMDMEKAVINDAFLVTLFQILIDTPQMTATEVLERAREKGMLLAPTAGRLQAEFLGTLIEREVSVLGRQGLLPKMPQMLIDQIAEYRVEYDSPMSRMQRAEKASGFMRALSQAAEYAKITGDVEPLDWFDFDQATPAILDIQGSPVLWTRDPQQVAARRKQRSDMQQAQQMIEAAPAVAGVAKAVGGS